MQQGRLRPDILRFTRCYIPAGICDLRIDDISTDISCLRHFRMRVISFCYRDYMPLAFSFSCDFLLLPILHAAGISLTRDIRFLPRLHAAGIFVFV